MLSTASVIARARSSFCCWLRPPYIKTLTIGISDPRTTRRTVVQESYPALDCVDENLTNGSEGPLKDLLNQSGRGDHCDDLAKDQAIVVVEQYCQQCCRGPCHQVSDQRLVPRRSIKNVSRQDQEQGKEVSGVLRDCGGQQEEDWPRSKLADRDNQRA